MNKKRITEVVKIVVSVVLFLTLALVITLFLDKEFVPLIEDMPNGTKRPLGILILAIGFLFVYLFFRATKFYYGTKEKESKLIMTAFLAALGATLLIQVGTKLLVY